MRDFTPIIYGSPWTFPYHVPILVGWFYHVIPITSNCMTIKNACVLSCYIRYTLLYPILSPNNHIPIGCNVGNPTINLPFGGWFWMACSAHVWSIGFTTPVLPHWSSKTSRHPACKSKARTCTRSRENRREELGLNDPKEWVVWTRKVRILWKVQWRIPKSRFGFQYVSILK